MPTPPPPEQTSASARRWERVVGAERARRSVPLVLLLLACASAYVAVPRPDESWQMPLAWTSSALVVCALLRLERRAGLLGLVAVAVVTALCWAEQGASWAAALGMALAYGGASEATRAVLVRGRDRAVLDDEGDVSRLMRAAGAGSVVGTAVFVLTTRFSELEATVSTVLSCFGGIAVSMIALLPLALRAHAFRPLGSPVERTTAAVLTIATTVVLFSDLVPAPVAFAVMPMFAWHAFRGTLRDASLVLVGMGSVAAALTAVGAGPIAALGDRWGLTPDAVNAVLQLFVLDCGIILLPISVVVTQQRRAAAKATAERATLERLIFSAAGSAIVATGADGRITVFNPAAEELWGYRADEVVGEVPDVLWSDEELRRMAGRLGTSPVVADLWRASVEQGRASELWRSRRSDGTQHVAEVVVSPMHDEHDAPAGFMVTAMDVTEREQAQRALIDTLEHQRSAVERLEELERVKGDFVATVSHELRTPITSIIGYTEVLDDGVVGELSDAQRDVVDRVDRNGRRLLALVEDLLTLSQIETSRLELEPEAVDLCDVVRDAQGELGPCLAGRRLDVHVLMPSRPVVHHADPAQLRRMLAKMLDNAVKFTPDGGRVTISVRLVEQGSQIVVSDTGAGIAADEQDRLFERFHRTQSATDGAVQGAGLGLTIVQAIAALHGGRVGIRSVEGRGTEVVVWLPSRQAASVPRVPVQGRAASA